MTRYHVSKDGTHKLCNAKKRNCPFGEEMHFEAATPQEAQKKSDKINEKIVNEEKDNQEMQDALKSASNIAEISKKFSKSIRTEQNMEYHDELVKERKKIFNQQEKLNENYNKTVDKQLNDNLKKINEIMAKDIYPKQFENNNIDLEIASRFSQEMNPEDMNYVEKEKKLERLHSMLNKMYHLEKRNDKLIQNCADKNIIDDFMRDTRTSESISNGINENIKAFYKSLDDSYDYKNIQKMPTQNKYERPFNLTNYIQDENLADAQAYLDDDLAQYQNNPKIKSIKIDLDHNDRGTVRIETIDELNEEELNLLQENIIGQMADGIGEGFEQQDFAQIYPDEGDFDTYEEYLDNQYDSYGMISFDWANKNQPGIKEIDFTPEDEVETDYNEVNDLKNNFNESNNKHKQFIDNFENNEVEINNINSTVDKCKKDLKYLEKTFKPFKNTSYEILRDIKEYSELNIDNIERNIYIHNLFNKKQLNENLIINKNFFEYKTNDFNDLRKVFISFLNNTRTA